MPYRAHVLRSGSDRRFPRDDLRRHRGGAREAALAKIAALCSRAISRGIYEALEGCPVTIRFLDPPLHEFVPTEEEDIAALAKTQGKSVEDIKALIASLHEFNPMMGHRGCRLTVTYPEIAEMQTTAVIEAAINVKKEHADWNIVPEIMIPLVGDVKELKYVKDIVVATADAVIADAGIDLKYEVGTMIEIPRAALTADEIATEAEFFCFGTNDLTQMTFGFSRDDAGKFLDAYYDTQDLRDAIPLPSWIRRAWAALVKMAVKLGKEDPPGPCKLRHLRRARRRPVLRGVLPRDRPELCLLLALPRADRPPRGGAGGHQGKEREIRFPPCIQSAPGGHPPGALSLWSVYIVDRSHCRRIRIAL